MHSSTSNSESPPQWPEEYWTRPIPSAHWRAVGLMTLLIVTVFFGLWEAFWRSEDYRPSFENTKDLWALQRARVGTHGSDETVLVGSSRILFDLDLDMWQQAFPGPRPIVLGIVGTGPLPILRDIAQDPAFTGTVICGVTEALFFIPAPAPPSAVSADFVKHYHNWSPSSRMSLYLSVPFESGFASLNKEDLSLDELLYRWIPLKNRPGTRVMPPYPPYFQSIEWDGRNKMWSRMETDPVLQKKVQQIWLPLFGLAPPFGGDGLTALIGSIKDDVERIRARGGQVVFVRFPSTGPLRELELEMWPREAYWDRLIRETGAPGIHFEDHSELMEFECPEWSHLTRSDAVSFTRRLAAIYRNTVGD